MQNRVFKYEELKSWVNVFGKGALDIMIVEGSGGTGKSSIVRQFYKHLPANQYLWVEGRTTAASLFKQLYDHRDLPIIIDDVDGLYRDKECINLLKSVCQTDDEKTVQWNTMTRINAGLPTSFKTKSKVCIITNCWKTLNKHVGAVQDRGLLILFKPPVEEVHRYVKDDLGTIPGVFDQEVYDFIGKNSGIIREPSIRHYRNALQLKLAGMEWKDALIESFGITESEMLVLKLLEDATVSDNKRSEMFAEQLKKSPRTYWRVKAELRERGMILPD